MNKKHASIWKLMAITFFGFALTISGNMQDPFLYSHKVAQLVPENEATALGFTTAAGLIVAVLAQPIIGVFSDRTRSRFGRRMPYFLVGVIGAVFCLYLIALAPSWWMVVAGILFIQAFSNTIQGPWQALIPDQVPDEQHGLAASVKGVLEVIAALVGGLAAGKIIAQAANWGDSAVILTATVPSAVFVIALALTFFGAKEDANMVAEDAGGRSIGEALKRTFYIDFKSYPSFAWWFGNRIFFWAGLLIVRTFLILFSRDVLGMTESAAQSYIGEVTIILGIFLMAALLPAGWLSDRLGRKPLVMASGAAAAIGTMLIVLIPSTTMVTIGGGLVGLGAGMFISTNWALVTDIVPGSEAARYLGMANIATAGGSLLGRALGGAIIDPVNAASGDRVTGYLVVYAIATVLFLASTLVVIGMPVRPVRERSTPA
jgi:MFS family permease